MTRLTVSLPGDLQQKLAAVAAKSGRSTEECALSALRDYIENYEDVYKTDLCSVDNLERSFFLSIGE